MKPGLITTCLATLCLAVIPSGAQARPEAMPKQDVVEIPAIADGLCVSNAFQTNMVIQRDKPIRVWGWAAPGAAVTVQCGGHTATATAAQDRSWKVTLPALAVHREPISMTIQSGKETLTLENILVGDVWVLGGQSNMEFEIAKVNDGDIEIASANFPQIRLLTIPQGKGFDSVASFERLHEWSGWFGRHFRKGDWDVCTPETVRDFTAIGYTFGRRIHMASGVPIGLIDASIGGTTVETWTPEAILQTIDAKETQAKLKEWQEKIDAFDPQADLKSEIAKFEDRKKKLEATGKPLPPDSKPPSEPRPGPAADMNRPGRCYASVIRPLEGLSACGAVFHQGFNNCFDGSAGARMYAQIFPHMIAAWRAAFMDEDMPFCIISLCTAGDPQTVENFTEPMVDAGPMIREAQYQTFRKLRDAGDATIGFADSFDFRKSWFHPQIKIPAGERAAKWAMATHYRLLGDRGAEGYWLPPSITECKAVDGELHLTFDTEIVTRDDSDGKLLGFAIAGEDRVFHPAEISYLVTGMNGNKPITNRKVLVLKSPMVPQPAHYRHAWARNPMTNLTNNHQIPIPAVRSDDWPMEELNAVPTEIAGDNPRARNGLIKRAAKLADTARQVQSAKAYLDRHEAAYQKDRAAFEQELQKQLERMKQ